MTCVIYPACVNSESVSYSVWWRVEFERSVIWPSHSSLSLSTAPHHDSSSGRICGEINISSVFPLLSDPTCFIIFWQLKCDPGSAFALWSAFSGFSFVFPSNSVRCGRHGDQQAAVLKPNECVRISSCPKHESIQSLRFVFLFSFLWIDFGIISVVRFCSRQNAACSDVSL